MTTRLLVYTFLLLFTSAAVSITAAQEPEPEVNLLKTVFIYNFAKFTRWPDSNDLSLKKSMNLCAIGNDDLADNLHMLNGKSLHGRPIRIDLVKNSSDLEGCHLLYLARSATKKTQYILESLDTKPILTVSETPRFSQSGGMIELKRDKDKIRFIINLKATRASGLELSARLLDLATVVNDETP